MRSRLWSRERLNPTSGGGSSVTRPCCFFGRLGNLVLFIVLLCLFGSLVKPSRGQAVALLPVVQPRLLVAAQAPVHGAANMAGTLALQHPLQYPRQQHPHLRHRQSRRPPFSPARSPTSGTRSPATLGFDGGASPPTSAPASPPSPPPPWPASSILPPGARR